MDTRISSPSPSVDTTTTIRSPRTKPGVYATNSSIRFYPVCSRTEIKNLILGEVQDEEISTTVQQLWISVNLARLQRIHGLTEKIKNRISGMKRKRPKESREPKKPKRSRPAKEPITEEHPVEQPVIGNLPNRSALSNQRGDPPRCQKPSPRSMKQVKPSKNQPDNSTESPVKVKDADTTTITRGKNHIFFNLVWGLVFQRN